jgi:PAS domain S-box-containing protein
MSVQRLSILDKLDRLVSRGSLFWVPLIVCILLAGLWFTTLHMIDVERATEEHDAKSTARDLSGVYAALMIRALDQMDLALGIVRYASEHQPPAKALTELQDGVLVPSSLLFAVTVINEHGMVVASNSANMPLDQSGKAYFQYFKQQRQIGDFLYSVQEMSPRHEMVMTFARRMNRADGRFAGVVIVTVDTNYLTSWYDSSRLGERGVIGIADSKTGRLIVTRTGDKLIWSNPAAPDVRRQVRTDQESVDLVDNPWDGERRFLVTEKLTRYPFAVLIGLSQKEHAIVFEQTRRSQLTKAMVTSGVLCLFGFMLCRMGLSQYRTRRAQETYHAASEASLDANFVMHTLSDSARKIHDFILVDVNSRATTLIGRSKQALIGKRLSELIHGFHTTPLFRQLTTAAQNGALSQHEWENHDDRIQAKWLSAQVVPVPDGIVAIVHDISNRKRYEAELVHRNEELMTLNKELAALNQEVLQAQEHLLQSEKLASIGLLAAGVAHEINNPIGFVLSNVSSLGEYIDELLLLLSYYQAAESHVDNLSERARLVDFRTQANLDYLREDIPVLIRETQDGISRVQKIVGDLKNFSHVDSQHEWRMVDLHECIESTLNIVNNDIKYKADVFKEYGELPQVECLPSEINQVIMNLLVNASHAIGSERGKITIRTGHDGSHAWFEVADTGCGIESGHLAHIFDPFFTTKPIGKGTGLGLSLSYGIVKKHHGVIEVQSEIGLGSRFRVTLPVTRSLQPADGTTHCDSPLKMGHSLRS